MKNLHHNGSKVFTMAAPAFDVNKYIYIKEAQEQSDLRQIESIDLDPNNASIIQTLSAG